MPTDTEEPRSLEAPTEDLGSDDFFDFDFEASSAETGGEEVDAGFDFSAYEKALRLKNRARAILGFGLIK